MLVAAAFVIAFVLGVSGFLSAGYDLGDSIYRSIGLFILQGGEWAKGTWQLEIARFLAPITLSTATIRGMVAIARSNSGVIGGRLLGSGHLILITSGIDNDRGILGLSTLARTNAYLAGRDLVLVAPDVNKLGRALRIAGARRCSEIVVALDNDEATLSLVHKLHTLLRQSSAGPRVPVRAEVDSWTMWSELQRVDFAGSTGTTWFNRDEVAAQMIAASLRQGETGEPVACSTDPEIARLALRASDLTESTFAVPEDPASLADHGLVCHRGADGTLKGATALAARLRPGGTLTAVCSGELAEVIERIGASSGVAVTTVDPAEWMSPWVTVSAEEMVARVIHERYRKMGTTGGWLAPDDPANRAWDQLPEQLRESSRAAARAIAQKLEDRKLAIRPLRPGASEAFEFEASEIEEMAVGEHERWCAERIASGWTSGERDVNTKKTPNLVPWEDLPEVEREKDRELVKAIPSWLRDFGYEIQR